MNFEYVDRARTVANAEYLSREINEIKISVENYNKLNEIADENKTAKKNVDLAKEKALELNTGLEMQLLLDNLKTSNSERLRLHARIIHLQENGMLMRISSLFCCNDCG